jgi:hypothetical protein
VKSAILFGPAWIEFFIRKEFAVRCTGGDGVDNSGQLKETLAPLADCGASGG